MASYIITGGNPLRGKIKISGNKNSILPCLAACLLTSEKITLNNVPNIKDVDVMVDILTSLGSQVQRENQTIRIKTPQITSTQPPEELLLKLRASVLIVGSLLGRAGEVSFVHPGGDVIGKRDIDFHLDGFQKLGFSLQMQDNKYYIHKSNPQNSDVSFFFEIASVTGTENLILASVLGNRKTTIRNCAQEPHVVDLCNMLRGMGAKVEGVGTHTLIITGVESLSGTNFSVGLDHMELGTYIIASAITKGELDLENGALVDYKPIIWPLEKMGLKFEVLGDNLKIYPSELKPLPKLVTNIWPGFPTDLMSVMITLVTQASGVSLMHDWIYESRMFFVDKLISMGANIIIADPHRVLVYGPTKLYGKTLESPDIRAGMAIVLAALIAEGTSTIHRAELIERGYENVVENLKGLGAQIERVE